MNLTRYAWFAAVALAVSAIGQVASHDASPTPTMVAVVHPEWSGIWRAVEGMGTNFTAFQPPRGKDDLPSLFPEEHGPFKAEVATAYLDRRVRQAKGMAIYDPMLDCLPLGMPGMMAAVHPYLIAVTPSLVMFYTESLNEMRTIFLDGRPHPSDFKPSLTGHSIGHWDGDTLVVDTIGISTQTNLSRGGIPHSDQLHLTERAHMRTDGQLEWEITAQDPGVLTAPWTTTKRYFRSKSEIREYVCEENRTTEARAVE